MTAALLLEPGASARGPARCIQMKAKKVVCAAFPYDMSATVDENVQTMLLQMQMDAFIEEAGSVRYGLVSSAFLQPFPTQRLPRSPCCPFHCAF